MHKKDIKSSLNTKQPQCQTTGVHNGIFKGTTGSSRKDEQDGKLFLICFVDYNMGGNCRNALLIRYFSISGTTVMEHFTYNKEECKRAPCGKERSTVAL